MENVGDDCLEIYKAIMKLGESTKYTIDTNSWNQNKKLFCPEESMILIKEASSVDLCEYAGNEVEVKVALNQGGKNRSAFGVMTFPIPHNVFVPTAAPINKFITISPTSAPVPQQR